MTEATVVLVILTCVIGISVIFERGKDVLMRSVDHTMRPIINSLFAEVSAVVFSITRLPTPTF